MCVARPRVAKYDSSLNEKYKYCGGRPVREGFLIPAMPWSHLTFFDLRLRSLVGHY